MLKIIRQLKSGKTIPSYQGTIQDKVFHFLEKLGLAKLHRYNAPEKTCSILTLCYGLEPHNQSEFFKFIINLIPI